MGLLEFTAFGASGVWENYIGFFGVHYGMQEVSDMEAASCTSLALQSRRQFNLHALNRKLEAVKHFALQSSKPTPSALNKTNS